MSVLHRFGVPSLVFFSCIAATILAMPSAAPSAIADELPVLSAAEIERMKFDGDRLADQGDYLGALKKYTRAYLAVVAEMRGQNFSENVEPNIYNREDLGKEMLAMIEEEYTPEDLMLMDSSYKVLGLAQPDINTGKLMTSMLTEEVAGFYDPDKKRMVLIVEDNNQPEPGWLGRLLGARPAFDKDEQKTTLAHELTHALQDQLYDLNAMQKGIEDDDDMLTAFSALVEGDATLLMFAEMDNTDITTMDPDGVRAMFTVTSWMMPLAGGETMRKAPPIFRDSLLFPYFQGMLFNLTIAKKDGWPAVHGAYQSPPVSTEQILHPSKYSGPDKDMPQLVSLPELGAAIAESGWKQLGGNVLGEFQTSILLKKVRDGKQASAGWDGDRYEVFEKDGRLGLVFVSIWDSEADAEEFANAYLRYRGESGREEIADSQDSDWSVQIAIESDEVFGENAVRNISRQGDRVIVIEGFDNPQTTALSTALEETKFTEKTFPMPNKNASGSDDAASEQE